jgi:hypothetical protein
MRPDTVIWFERLFLMSLALGVFKAWYAWNEAVALAPAPFVLFVEVSTIILILALVLFVSRARSRVAKWILIVIFILGLPASYKLIAG